MGKTGEHQIAEGVMRIAAQHNDGVATFKQIYKTLPKHVALQSVDLYPSITRNGEPMWHQIVRNIKSHYDQEGNAIYEGWLEHVPRVGYKITNRGQKHLRKTH